ncbi:parapinopsin-like [Mya arenaria]|uniref:parapinopsin-like n=1 Tax=Mya arenaria TaxID=6604 RepID=UPI0022E1977A|nr:parapinopsin-like [Mya arenaria]
MIFNGTPVHFQIWKEKKMRSAWIQKRSVMRDVKVTLSVAFVILSFIISWTPYAVVSLLTALFKMNLEDISPVIVQLPCLMAKAACIWNPLVYVYHNREFRKAFMKKFRQWNKSPSSEATNVLQNDSYNRPNTFERISSAAKEIGYQIKSLGESVKRNELEANCSERVTIHRPKDAVKPEMIVIKETML